MAQYLNPKQRTILIKFLAYLGLVRWYNLALIAIAQYLAAVFLLNKNQTAFEILSNPSLHLLVLSCGMVIAGGYLINAFYDIEKDLANRPRKLIIGRIISKTFALRTYLLFNFLALIVSLFLGFQVFLFLTLFSFLLWFYSHKLKKISFIGNLTATFLSVCSFFAVCVFYMQISKAIVFYVIFLILAELIRELVKDMEAIKGDVVYGYRTVSIALGIPKTKKLIYGLMVLGLVPIILVYQLQGWVPIMYFLTLAFFLWMIAAFMLSFAQERKDFAAVNSLLKVVIVLGVFSIVLV